MTNWTETLSRKQAMAARAALSAEMAIADHIQAYRSEIDGWAMVDVFVGRRCHTVSLGPRGSIKSQSSNLIA
jgi:hypothetical protein